MNFAIVLLSALTLVSCFNSAPPGSNYLAGIQSAQRPNSSSNKHPTPAIPDDISYWEGDHISGEPLIRINRNEQKAYFYKSGVLVGLSKISSGKEDSGTPPGRYKITQKSKDHKSSLYGVIKDVATGQTINDNADVRLHKPGPGQVFVHAPMANFMRFNNAIGMHTGFLPGYAASHGCVRMPHHMSEKFFNNVEIGTPVIVE